MNLRSWIPIVGFLLASGLPAHARSVPDDGERAPAFLGVYLEDGQEGGALITGVAFAFVMVQIKYSNPDTAFTHWFNQATYFIKNGFVLLILSAAFLYKPSRRLVFAGLFASVPLTALFTWGFEDMNYFVSSGWVILLSFAIVAVPAAVASRGKRLVPEALCDLSDKTVNWFGAILLGTLLLAHVVFS